MSLKKSLILYVLIVLSAVVAYGAGYYLGFKDNLSEKTLSSYDFLNRLENTESRLPAKE